MERAVHHLVAREGVMPFRKILCPVDFSAGSQHAMHVAARLATRTEAELVLAYVWYLPPLMFASEYPFPYETIQLMVQDNERELAELAREATNRGATRVTTRSLTGVPWQQIVETLEADPTFDLAVLGSHGRTGLERILLGSVTERVVRHAPCAVLATRGRDETLGHVLCPIDFSDHARRAVALAAELAGPGGITLLHVLELPVAYAGDPGIPGFLEGLDRRSAELLDQWAAELRATVAVPVTTRLIIGSPGAQTLTVLDRDPTINLVVMGSHGRTGIRRVLLGSVAEKVVRHARCSVLVTHPRD